MSWTRDLRGVKNHTQPLERHAAGKAPPQTEPELQEKNQEKQGPEGW